MVEAEHQRRGGEQGEETALQKEGVALQKGEVLSPPVGRVWGVGDTKTKANQILVQIHQSETEEMPGEKGRKLSK